MLPKNSPQRRLLRIDDSEMRTKLNDIFVAMRNVIQAIMSEQIPIDKSIALIWRQFPWPVDFSDKDYSDAFHYAANCIVEYERFRYADTIEQGTSIPDDLTGQYDKDERLLDVTTLKPLREAFVKSSSKLAVIPRYKADYGLKEKFAQLFQNGIPHNWRMWIAPAEIIAEDRVPQTIYIQEEHQWGLKFNEDAFKKIFTKAYGEFEYVNNELPYRLMRTPLYKLQYAIESNDKEKRSSAIIEELIDITYGQSMIDPKVFVYGSAEHYYVRHRMIHLMYDQTRSTFIHLDLSRTIT